eukprot:COSAG02_NODE_5828_length_4008_cov_3.994372_1_plen_154_part_10
MQAVCRPRVAQCRTSAPPCADQRTDLYLSCFPRALPPADAHRTQHRRMLASEAASVPSAKSPLSRSKMSLAIHRVWRICPPEVGAEFGSCCRSARAILIGILQNRQEMQFSAKDRLQQFSCGAEVGRQGHPPNFVRPSIEGEQKFGGWICQRWV